MSDDVADHMTVDHEDIMDGTVVHSTRRRRRSTEVTAMSVQARSTYGVTTDGISEEARDAQADIKDRFARIASGVPVANSHTPTYINIIATPKKSDIYER